MPAAARLSPRFQVADAPRSTGTSARRRSSESGMLAVLAWMLGGILLVNLGMAAMMFAWEMRYQDLRKRIKQASEEIDREVRQLEDSMRRFAD